MLQVARASSGESLLSDFVSGSSGSSPCISGSLPFLNCDFSPGATGNNACWAGVNTGQAANSYNSACRVPTPENGCRIQLEPAKSDLTWQWKSPSVECCNCFQQ